MRYTTANERFSTRGPGRAIKIFFGKYIVHDVGDLSIASKLSILGNSLSLSVLAILTQSGSENWESLIYSLPEAAS